MAELKDDNVFYKGMKIPKRNTFLENKNIFSQVMTTEKIIVSTDMMVVIMKVRTYLIFVTSTTSRVLVSKFSGRCQKKCKLVCFGVKIMNFVFFGVKKSGISVFLVSIENGAGVQKMTNIRYAGSSVIVVLVSRAFQKYSTCIVYI